MKRFFLLLTCMLTGLASALAQDDVGEPTMMPSVKVGKVLVDGDSIQYMEMSDVFVYPPPTFKSKRQQRAYTKLVRNVKKTLPIAKAREEHMKRVEKSIVKEYTPRMKKLSFSQGKLLIKLVDRECNSTAYEAMKAFLGPVRSGVWQAFAWAFGASLKKGYDAEGVDRLTERVVLMVEAGQL